MKKIISVILALLITASMASVFVSADQTDSGVVVDMTDSVKMVYVLDAYARDLPIISSGATFYDSTEYTNIIGNDPGTSIRILKIYDWNFKVNPNDMGFDTVEDEGDGTKTATFIYSAIWLKVADDAVEQADIDNTSAVYEIEIPKDGKYEFVFVVAAQIKAGGIDRGFGWDIDESGVKKTVTINPITFDGDSYVYEYSYADMDTADGRNDFYQTGYVYGIFEDLTAGTHSLSIYNLPGSPMSRPNLCGFYIQNVVRPEDTTEADTAEETTGDTVVTTAEETTVETVVTTAENTSSEVITTTEITTAETTASISAQTTEVATTPIGTTAADTTSGETTTSAAGDGNKGCGGIIVGASLALISLAAVTVLSKKKHND